MSNIAVSMGDPAGIGPEIILKSLQDLKSPPSDNLYVFGDASVLLETSRRIGLPFELPVIPLARFRQQLPPQTCVVDLANVHGRLHWGVERAEYGRASMQFIEAAVFSCLSGQLDALVTAPIHKRAIHLAGYDFPGHTEFLAALTGAPQVLMAFHAAGIWTVLGTTHLPLQEAIAGLNKGRLKGVIEMAYRELRKYVLQPRLAVAAINPHASEGGLFGMEESMVIMPAVDECRQSDIPVGGPHPADTIFLQALRGEYNIIVCHYHDQGLIAVKLLSFGKAVNVTLGLPFLRTSVDHGTAFDIAGKGVASPESLQEALRLTAEMLSRFSGRTPA